MGNNNSKYHKNALYNKSLEGRWEHVRRILDMYRDYNDIIGKSDLTWLIKDALVGEIHFSEKAMDFLGGNMPSKISVRETCILEEIQEVGSYRILCHNGILRGEGLAIYNKITGLIFEHVIPNRVYRDKLIDLYNNNELDETRFEWLMSQIHACFICKEEDEALGEKCLSQKMPKGWQWGDNPFARYDACGIKVWKGLKL